MPRCQGPSVSHQLQRCSSRRQNLEAYRATLNLALPPRPTEYAIRLARVLEERRVRQALNDLNHSNQPIPAPEPPKEPIPLRTASAPFPPHPREITLAIASHLPFDRTLLSLASTSRWYRSAVTPLLLRLWFGYFRYHYVSVCFCGGWRGMLAPDQPLSCGEECPLRLCINECSHAMDVVYQRREWVYWLAHFLVVTGYDEAEGEAEGQGYMQRMVGMAFRGEKGGLWAIEMLREVLVIRETFKRSAPYSGPDPEFPKEETDWLGHLYYDYINEDSDRGVKYRRREMEMIKAICEIAEKPVDYLGMALHEEIFALVWDVGHVDMLRYLFDSGRLDHPGLWDQNYDSTHLLDLPRQPGNGVYGKDSNPFLWQRSIINVVAAVNADYEIKNPAPIHPRRHILQYPAQVTCTVAETSLWLNSYWEIFDLMIEKHPEMMNWRMQYNGEKRHVHDREHLPLKPHSIFPFDAGAVALKHGVLRTHTKAGEEATRKLLGKLHAAGADFSLALKRCFPQSYSTSWDGPSNAQRYRLEFQFKNWIPLLFQYGAKPDDIIPKPDELKLKWTPLHPYGNWLPDSPRWNDEIFHMFLDAGYSGIAVPIGATSVHDLSYGPTALEYIVESCLRTRGADKEMLLQCLDVLLRKRPACLDLPEWEECLSRVRKGAEEELSMEDTELEEEKEAEVPKPGMVEYRQIPRKPSDYGSVLKVMEAAEVRRGQK